MQFYHSVGVQYGFPIWGFGSFFQQHSTSYLVMLIFSEILISQSYQFSFQSWKNLIKIKLCLNQTAFLLHSSELENLALTLKKNLMQFLQLCWFQTFDRSKRNIDSLRYGKGIHIGSKMDCWHSCPSIAAAKPMKCAILVRTSLLQQILNRKKKNIIH